MFKKITKGLSFTEIYLGMCSIFCMTMIVNKVIKANKGGSNEGGD